LLTKLSDNRYGVPSLEPIQGHSGGSIESHHPVPIGFFSPGVSVPDVSMGRHGEPGDFGAAGGDSLFRICAQTTIENHLVDGVHETSLLDMRKRRCRKSRANGNRAFSNGEADLLFGFSAGGGEKPADEDREGTAVLESFLFCSGRLARK